MLPRVFLLFLIIWPLAAEKRPFSADDYAKWKHIQNQRLSPDGHVLVYAVFPQEGDGELVVRDLRSGKETRQPAGELPPPPPPNNATPQVEEGPAPPPGVAVKFSNDSQKVAFLTFASHDLVEKAKREKRKPEDMPKGDLVIVNVASGDAARIPHVLSFEMPAKSSDFLAYLQQQEGSSAEGKSASTVSPPASSRTGEGETRGRRTQLGDLVIRTLKDGTERRFPDTTEYLLAQDGTLAVFAVASRQPESAGVFALRTAGAGGPAALLTGKGKYERLAWDREQRTLAFVSDRGMADSKQAGFGLYMWDRQAPAASQLASAETARIPKDWIISDKPPITVARGGKRIFFGTAPRPKPELPPDNTPPDEKLTMDLWSWKDDYIQPMQKVRLAVERGRTYRAVYDLASHRVTQLADPSMSEASPSDDGNYVIGGDDREYRRMQEYSERLEDTYFVDVATGGRKLIAKKHSGRLAWSPDSKHAVYLNGKDWILISAADSGIANLTSGLPVPFGREEYDQPGHPPAEGPALWTSDGRYLFLYDRFDVWRVNVDNHSATNLTNSLGRKSRISFRIVRSNEGGEDRGLNPAKPLLLRAENQDTRDTGFYRTTADATSDPTKLIMADRNFAPPVKARDADVYVTAASTFNQFPDLLLTDGAFRELKKVTELGSQLNAYTWGTAELVHFKSSDGLPLQATLYKPENFDPKKKYPMIVYIYERLTQNLNLFVEPKPMDSINPAVYVSNGYLVLEPDIAYKVGYPGQSALNCVLPAVQEVVDKGFVNEQAIGIQGHSWGGYQIAYMVTRTSRFRAAEAGAPVANMISAYDGIRWGPGMPRQFQYERTQSRIGGSLWEYPLRFIENSPIFMADRVTTPLLMVHNDAVPWYQGIEYFLALRRLNKEVYMFTYNGEPHHVRKRVHQKDYALRMQQYFDYFLKGAPKPDWMEHGIPFIDKDGASTSPTSAASDEP